MSHLFIFSDTFNFCFVFFLNDFYKFLINTLLVRLFSERFCSTMMNYDFNEKVLSSIEIILCSLTVRLNKRFASVCINLHRAIEGNALEWVRSITVLSHFLFANIGPIGMQEYAYWFKASTIYSWLTTMIMIWCEISKFWSQPIRA